MSDEYLDWPITTRAELARFARAHAQWLNASARVTRDAESHRRHFDDEARDQHDYALMRMDLARFELDAADAPPLREEVTAEARAAIAALTGRLHGSPSEAQRREDIAAAYIYAARGDTSRLDGLGIEHRVDEHGSTLVPLAARAATASDDILELVDEGATYPLVRPGSVLDHLGIWPTFVEDGQLAYGWLRTAPDASHRTEDATLAALTAEQSAWSTHTMRPGRWTDVRGITLEAQRRWTGSLNELLMDVAANLGDGAEREILAGDNTPGANQIEWDGLNHRSALARMAPTDPDTYDTAVRAIAGQVDGRYATRNEDLRIVLSADMHEHLAGLIHPGSGRSVNDWIAENTAGARVSAHWPTAVNHVGRVLVKRGSRPGSVVWVAWRSMGMIIDPYSAAGVGTKLAAYAISDLYVPNEADDKRSDYTRVHIRTGGGA